MNNSLENRIVKEIEELEDLIVYSTDTNITINQFKAV